MRKTGLILGMPVLLSVLAGCGKSGDGDRMPPDDAYLLYHKTNRLLRQYYDSISQAPDSATAIGAFEHLNSELDSLNFSVEADTDLKLTEGENDTTYRNIIAVRKLYDRKLVEFGRKQHEPEEE